MVGITELKHMEKVLLKLQENNGQLAIEVIFEITGYKNYGLIRKLENLGLIGRRGKWGSGIVLSQGIANNDGKIDILSYLRILTRFGLVNLDMKIIWAKGDSPEEITQNTGLLANIVKQHQVSIFTRLGVSSLREARMRIKREATVFKQEILA